MRWKGSSFGILKLFNSGGKDFSSHVYLTIGINGGNDDDG
ncbi:hypothetical protein S7335_3701 [Synechococcus sp. PCC 7335]|nr:hypothetical protein S7335_3701 [Synechococcus sp. PCC 7335]